MAGWGGIRTALKQITPPGPFGKSSGEELQLHCRGAGPSGSSLAAAVASAQSKPFVLGIAPVSTPCQHVD